ncbi:extradiol ring-cleavage dioxygenase [Amycolatopsis acidicola]|uniref:Extradiol ring-cleavage dioxygenase n=1 Tax=Amycolatopsis acidicola TaxID=2596893 RepID=A0A5N0V463_9PSEU|nr:VOC family protein [Amycolatopsis acidicola]KAA9160765.1 extradiol ring-cleavage dioxygenase [Amycolatopsis acidicola]
MNVFGAVHLGYLVIETHKFTDWLRFGRDAIGLHVDELDAATLRFRLDDHDCRFLLRWGPAEDVTTLGWHIDDHDTFDHILKRVADRGVPIEEAGAEEAALRGVERLWRFPGPKGLVQEIFTAPVRSGRPLALRTAGFVTGESGMGHVALTTTRPEQLRGYYDTVFDARLSDYIDETISGVKLKIRFLRVNQRHHSIALAATRGLRLDPVRTRVQHLNIQVAELDDMTRSYQRVKELGFDMALSVGQHTNDKELSYYALTPSGFEWEVGWNPVTVDESTWEPTTHKGISIWGHTPVGQTIIDKLAQFNQASRSLREREDTVPALSGDGIPDD